jgi:hypothetical protein
MPAFFVWEKYNFLKGYDDLVWSEVSMFNTAKNGAYLL